MKKTVLLLLAVTGMGIISQADAQNAIYLTGSTAFRNNCYAVLAAASPVGPWDATPNIATRGNATVTKANYMIFHGTIGGTETYVSCYWSGSEAGIASVAGNNINNNPYGTLPGAPATFMKTDGSVAYTTIAANPTGAELEASSRAGDLAMADTSKDVSLSSTFAFHDFGKVGIIPFTWVKCYQSAPLAALSRFTSITHDQIRVLLGFPQVAAFFTGNPADTNHYVYPIGRNKGSGTRVNTLADAGYGITKPVVQWSINGIPYTGVGNAASLAEVDNNGYESGGDVAKAVSTDGSQTATGPDGNPGFITVGYMSTGDAIKSADAPNNQGALTIADNWLALNGVMESDGTVEEGQYSMWGNEHLYGASGISGFKLTFGNTFAALVGASLGGSDPAAHSGGIKLSYMHAEKQTDTAVPTRL